MRLFNTIAGVCLIGVAVSSAHKGGRQSNLPCVTPGTQSQITVQAIKLELVRPDSNAIRFRNAVGIAGVDSSIVAVVTDTVICTRIHQVVDSAFQISPPSDTAYPSCPARGPRFVSFPSVGPSQSALYITDTNFVWKHFVP